MKAARLKEKYVQEIIPALKQQFQYKSIMQVPRLEKICINKGIGGAVTDKKLITFGVDEITAITGQKAVVTHAKKSISNFKLREDMPIGVKVTLRGNRMFEFMDRLINVALPRVRDFRGISPKGFDKQGNYTMGIKEQIIFPEISIDKVQKIDGMDITFVTSSATMEESYQLMKAFGMPFVNKN